MPHLSPMHWMMALLSTTLFILMTMSSMWWTQQPKFKITSMKLLNTKSKWSWNL